MTIAPFKVHLLIIGTTAEVQAAAMAWTDKLQTAGIEVLVDDRDLRPGEKFADADLLGLPLRLIISDKTLASGECEIKERASGQVNMLKTEAVIPFIQNYK